MLDCCCKREDLNFLCSRYIILKDKTKKKYLNRLVNPSNRKTIFDEQLTPLLKKNSSDTYDSRSLREDNFLEIFKLLKVL